MVMMMVPTIQESDGGASGGKGNACKLPMPCQGAEGFFKQYVRMLEVPSQPGYLR